MGTLDPQKLIKFKINHMNIFHMKISQIMVISIAFVYINLCSNYKQTDACKLIGYGEVGTLVLSILCMVMQ